MRVKEFETIQSKKSKTLFKLSIPFFPSSFLVVTCYFVSYQMPIPPNAQNIYIDLLYFLVSIRVQDSSFDK